jgi:hypothetical protein
VFTRRLKDAGITPSMGTVGDAAAMSPTMAVLAGMALESTTGTDHSVRCGPENSEPP